MLVISRRKGQGIAIGDEIELVVTELHGSSVKLGIRAPHDCVVRRSEMGTEASDRLAALRARRLGAAGSDPRTPLSAVPDTTSKEQ